MACPVPPRTRFPAALALAAAACALTSACGPSGNTTASSHPSAWGGTSQPNGASPPSSPSPWGGVSQGQPPASLVSSMDAEARRNAARLGISGTPVHAWYDDRADGAWISYYGVTGTGFDPDHLYDLLNSLPSGRDDGSGDLITTSAIGALPGPHGGRAICDTVLVQNESLTTASTTRSWFTPTTAAGISLTIKGDGTNTKVGLTATDVAPIMRALRAEVEQPRR